MSQPSWTVTKALMPRLRICFGEGATRKSNLSFAGKSVSTRRRFRSASGAKGPAGDDSSADRRRRPRPFGGENFLAFGLGDAPRDDDFGGLPGAGAFGLQNAQLAQFREDLLGCALADVASVQDHEIGVFDSRRLGRNPPGSEDRPCAGSRRHSSGSQKTARKACARGGSSELWLGLANSLDFKCKCSESDIVPAIFEA